MLEKHRQALVSGNSAVGQSPAHNIESQLHDSTTGAPDSATGSEPDCTIMPHPEHPYGVLPIERPVNAWLLRTVGCSKPRLSSHDS
jgi:hypothetical protein